MPGSRRPGQESSLSSSSPASSSTITRSSATGRRRQSALSAFIARQSQFIFEAHSTDYQSPGALEALVRDHFAILKVGPGATYALREAIWGLAAIEQALDGDGRVPDLRKVVVAVMRSDPQHWRGHYDDKGGRLDLDLQYSLSDRIRYYWPYPEVQRAVAAMRERLDRRPIPLTLLSQFLPRQHDAVREGRIAGTTAEILREGVAAALAALRRCLRRRAEGDGMSTNGFPGAAGRRARVARGCLDGTRDRAATGSVD